MIEVESRFVLTPESQARLLDGAIKKEETVFTVQFLDTPDWQLAFNNLWLKLKKKKYELKVPLENQPKGDSDHLATVFDEVTDLTRILNILKIEHRTDFEAALTEANIRSFASIETIRTSYQKGPFLLDLDQAQFPLLKTGQVYHYAVAEIELQTTPALVPQARKDIITFAEQHGLQVSDTRGKLMEFVFQNYPDVYGEFVRRGLISS